MRCHRYIGSTSAGPHRDHISRPVETHFPTQRLKLLGHPQRALFLKEGGGWDAAQLEVLLVDPVALTAEPFETQASRGGPRKVSD